ncbi:MAG: peptide MFS transporter, partial [Variibacter sp.]|nr:peptide MFS transporter [Variibacter sp.]
TVLFMTEMWERFSYFGMSALLILYMVKYLFLPAQAELVIGYGAMKAALETVLGPLQPQPLASQLFGIYTALAYLTPILGGIIADRLLGQRRTVLVGAMIMCSAHFMLAFEHLFLIALCALIVGNGLLKPNISTQVGGLYRADDPRLDRAYSIFYTGINVGAFIAPLVCSTLAEKFGWRYGFIAAGTGMLIGMAIYVLGWRAMPAGAPPRRRQAEAAAPPLSARERRAILALLMVCVLVTFFWATFDQQYNTMILWAEFFTDRSVDLGFWRGEVPAAYFLSINPLMIFIATPLVIRFWAWQSRRGTEPTSFAKLGYGFMGVAAANLIMVAAAWHAGASGKAGWAWVVVYYAVLTFGELYLAPVGLSLISKMAPPRLLSMMMGVWLATTFPGDLLGGWLGTLWSGMAKTSFFLLIASIAGGAGALMWVMGPRIQAIAERA